MSADEDLKCSEAHCHPDAGCKLGEALESCPHFQELVKEDSDTPIKLPDGNGVPWTGSALGIDDIAWLASRERPLLLAPIGNHNVGKTTFLSALYIGLCRGILPADHKFAGSYTFGGWEKLAAFIRHAPDGLGPCFPPHTPVTSNRSPGWLHLGLKGPNDQLKDVLIADAPGEWFSRWALHPNGEGTDGARWIAKHADGFLFFVDSDALAGNDRRNIAEHTETLAKRIASVVNSRPVAVVWSKNDIDVPLQLRTDVEQALKNALPNAVTFPISVHSDPTIIEPTVAFWKPVEWLLANQQKSIHPLTVPETIDSADPFLAYRG